MTDAEFRTFVVREIRRVLGQRTRMANGYIGQSAFENFIQTTADRITKERTPCLTNTVSLSSAPEEPNPSPSVKWTWNPQTDLNQRS